jgi:hypothetical protein
MFGVSQATVSRRWDLLRPLIGDALADVVPDPLEVVGRGTVLVGGTVCPTWDWRHVPGSAAEPRSGLQDRCKRAAQTCFKKVLLVPHWSLHGQHAHHGSRLAPGGHAARPRCA